MGLFDFFFGARKAAMPSDELRELLFAAIRANDRQRLAELSNEHHDAILGEFPKWTTAPAAIRQDLAAVQAYGQALGALADFFACDRGEPQLRQHLLGPDEANPIVQWPRKLQQAEGLMMELRFEDAIGLLTDLLTNVEHLQDLPGSNFAAVNLARTHGLLGHGYFQTGRADQAVGQLARALELCQQDGDAQVAYLGNLFEAHRYLGQSGAAADAAERLAQVLAGQGKGEEAAWFRKQARIVRGGEPLVRVIAAANGRRYELDDPAIRSRGGSFDFIFHRNRITLQPALHLTDQGLQLGNQGQYQEAFSALIAATKADRFDPQPFYHMGACLLYGGLYNEAAMSYRKAEELAPGWFHCRRYFWLAEQLGAGRLDHDTFLTLQALDYVRRDRTPQAKVALAREGLNKTPDVAWLHLCLGGYLKELGQRQEAEAAFRRGVDRAEHANDIDVQSCLMLELALVLPEKSPERIRLLEAVRELNGNLIATASAGLVLNTPGSR
jgi:tetratricopeptide (TPR) repeat protein